MKLRYKFFTAMVLLVVFMAGSFLTISSGYLESMFRQYAIAVQQGEATRWSSTLTYYYEMNHESWTGVSDFISLAVNSKPDGGRGGDLQELTVYNMSGQQIASVSAGNQGDLKNLGVTIPIMYNDKQIATLYVVDHDLEGLEQLQNQVLRTMTQASLVGLGITAIVALLIALWMTRLLTRPLSRLMVEIKRIAAGDLRPMGSRPSSDEFGEVLHAFDEMVAKLSQALDARRRLVADVAHELRTPLTIVQGQLELIQQGVVKLEPGTLLPVQDEVIRLEKLVGDLHQLSLAESGQLNLKTGPVDLVGLVQKIINNFQLEAMSSELALTFESKEEAIVANVDSHRITQVFVNLIGNALRYTPQGGRIHVQVAKNSDMVEVSVSDTGPGIPETHLPHLFDRFYRTEEARSRDSGGTGLGLAIAKEFVGAHHGEIAVTSVVGHGTTFTVRLPLE